MFDFLYAVWLAAFVAAVAYFAYQFGYRAGHDAAKRSIRQ